MGVNNMAELVDVEQKHRVYTGFNKLEWLDLVTRIEGSGPKEGETKNVGFIMGVVRKEDEGKLAILFTDTSQHSQFLEDNKEFFGFSEPGFVAADVLIKRKNEYQTSGLQIWYRGDGKISAVDYNICTSWIEPKDVVEITKAVLNKFPEDYLTNKVEVRLGDPERATEGKVRPKHYVMVKIDGGWRLSKDVNFIDGKLNYWP